MRAAYRRLKRAITFVYRLSLTTVVYSSGPVTRWMWNDPLPLLRVEPEVVPQPGGLDEDLGALVGQEVDVAGGVEVALEGEHDVGVDVVLRRAGGVVGRRLLAVDRAPRVQPADLVELAGPAAGCIEHVPAEPQQLPSGVGSVYARNGTTYTSVSQK